jgi:Spy/CpxP family protein refolding chaperone
MQQMRDAVEPLIGSAWSEIAKPDADETKVVQLFEEAGQTRRRYMRELAPKTLSFLATLSSEQRAKFVELARQRPWEKQHRHAPP